jgi:hypothetical protein
MVGVSLGTPVIIEGVETMSKGFLAQLLAASRFFAVFVGMGGIASPTARSYLHSFTGASP